MKPKVSITFPGIRIVTEPLLLPLQDQLWIMYWKEAVKPAMAGRVGSVSPDVLQIV